jgi:uncharacterized protein
MREIHAALSINSDPRLIQAALPLFEGEEVDALEWSFDTLYKQPVTSRSETSRSARSFDTLYQQPELPEWFEELLQTYGTAGRLVGHGVYFSLFSSKWLSEQTQWLHALRDLCQKYRFDHVSEHFGFLTGTDFHKGAPLSVPFTARTLAIGQDRLMRIADACGCPVGLENLAFATDMESARVHGAFLDALLEPVNGFVILDLHNLYCQLRNFDLNLEELLAAFPLHRVREIHISGGSWEVSHFRENPGVRRDTHDDRVPEEVFGMLADVIPRCPSLKLVVMEQLTHALGSVEEQEGFRADFRRCREMVQAAGAVGEFAAGNGNRGIGETALENWGNGKGKSAFKTDLIPPLEDFQLYFEQRVLSNIRNRAPPL